MIFCITIESSGINEPLTSMHQSIFVTFTLIKESPLSCLNRSAKILVYFYTSRIYFTRLLLSSLQPSLSVIHIETPILFCLNRMFLMFNPLTLSWRVAFNCAFFLSRKHLEIPVRRTRKPSHDTSSKASYLSCLVAGLEASRASLVRSSSRSWTHGILRWRLSMACSEIGVVKILIGAFD